MAQLAASRSAFSPEASSCRPAARTEAVAYLQAAGLQHRPPAIRLPGPDGLPTHRSRPTSLAGVVIVLASRMAGRGSAGGCEKRLSQAKSGLERGMPWYSATPPFRPPRSVIGRRDFHPVHMGQRGFPAGGLLPLAPKKPRDAETDREGCCGLSVPQFWAVAGRLTASGRWSASSPHAPSVPARPRQGMPPGEHYGNDRVAAGPRWTAEWAPPRRGVEVVIRQVNWAAAFQPDGRSGRRNSGRDADGEGARACC